MKTLIVFLVLLLPICTWAQRGLKPMDEKPTESYDPKRYANEQQTAPAETVESKDYTAQVMQTTGKKYTADELSRMARKDVNGVASTIAGVQSLDGGTPQIRGAAASGTAYFVDGVRVYGALPILTK